MPIESLLIIVALLLAVVGTAMAFCVARKTTKRSRPTSEQVPEQFEMYGVNFSPDDLGLIRIMPGATVGGGMVLPSGLKTTDEVITLSDDFSKNVELMASIIQT